MAARPMDATHPHERNRASYLQENFVPLMDAGVLTLVDDGAEIIPGVKYRRSGGATTPLGRNTTRVVSRAYGVGLLPIQVMLTNGDTR